MSVGGVRSDSLENPAHECHDLMKIVAGRANYDSNRPDSGYPGTNQVVGGDDMFSRKLTSVLSGATVSQLERWARKGLIVPEIRESRPPLYSFRDLVALRYIARLRQSVSLQKIGTAMRNLDVLDMTEHPSRYDFGTDGETIFVRDPENGHAIDLVKKSLESTIFSFEDLSREFVNFRGDKVVDFRQPSPNIEVDARRVGGMPTIANTRIPYSTIASLTATGEISVEEVKNYYPSVSSQAAREAIAFDALVKQAS